MRVFAYCADSFADAARLAVGVEPVTSPPVFAASFEPAWLAGHDLVYFDLHGQPGEAVWYGDVGAALTADQVRQADLGGAVVLALSCYLGDDDSPMLDALLDAGAGAVIGGPGRNYGGRRTLFGAGRLARHVREQLERGLGPLQALERAKRRSLAEMILSGLLARADRARAARDALGFRLFERRKTLTHVKA